MSANRDECAAKDRQIELQRTALQMIGAVAREGLSMDTEPEEKATR